MKVRLVITVDVNEDRWRDRYPFLSEREGSVRQAVRSYIRGALLNSEACRSEAICEVKMFDN